MIKNKKKSFNLLILIWLIVGITYGIGLIPSPTRLNFLHFSFVWLIVLGIKPFYKKRAIFVLILAIYTISFSLFCNEYFKNYIKLTEKEFSTGLEDALTHANNARKTTNYNILITEDYFIYPKILWYQKIPTNDYLQTNVWRHYPQAYLASSSFLHYRFKDKLDANKISTDSIYITEKENIHLFNKFDTKKFGRYIVAIPKYQVNL